MCVLVWFLRACPCMMLLACCVYVWQQLCVWLQLQCLFGMNSACMWPGSCEHTCVCVCLRDGMGCMFTGLQSGAGWRPAETMGLENGVCLCDPLLSQRETPQLSPLSLLSCVCLTHSLCFHVRSFSFSFSSAPLSSFPTSLEISFSACAFSHHISYQPCFLCIRLSPCIFFFFHVFLLLTVPSFHTTNCLLLPSQAECISNRTRYWNERLERKLTNVRIYTPWGCRLCVEYRT